jgi:hypothetical protein
VKTIPLTQGKSVLVDDEDYVWLNQWKWSLASHRLKNRIIYYGVRKVCGHHVKMHREVLGIVDSKIKIDHVNGNGLDNQKVNLRQANMAQNRQNSRKSPNCTSRFKGVSWHKHMGRWQVRIQVGGQVCNLGYFVEEAVAARVYNQVAKHSFGAFAYGNAI